MNLSSWASWIGPVQSLRERLGLPRAEAALALEQDVGHAEVAGEEPRVNFAVRILSEFCQNFVKF